MVVGRGDTNGQLVGSPCLMYLGLTSGSEGSFIWTTEIYSTHNLLGLVMGLSVPSLDYWNMTGN